MDLLKETISKLCWGINEDDFENVLESDLQNSFEVMYAKKGKRFIIINNMIIKFLWKDFWEFVEIFKKLLKLYGVNNLFSS